MHREQMGSKVENEADLYLIICVYIHLCIYIRIYVYAQLHSEQMSSEAEVKDAMYIII